MENDGSNPERFIKPGGTDVLDHKENVCDCRVYL